MEKGLCRFHFLPHSLAVRLLDVYVYVFFPDHEIWTLNVSESDFVGRIYGGGAVSCAIPLQLLLRIRSSCLVPSTVDCAQHLRATMCSVSAAAVLRAHDHDLSCARARDFDSARGVFSLRACDVSIARHQHRQCSAAVSSSYSRRSIHTPSAVRSSSLPP